MTDYDPRPIDELLGLLQRSGRAPDPDLIRACLARGREVTPVLLDWLAAENENRQADEEGWDDDDPRWYRGVHAALILIGLREPAALPILSDRIASEDGEYLLEWVETELPVYGALATDWAIELMNDRSGGEAVRIAAINLLGAIGWSHPDELLRILPALRALLPPVDPNGRVMLPDEARRAEPDPVWSWDAFVLGQLRDIESQPNIVALYQEDLIDEWIQGDLHDYLKEFTPDASPPVYSHETYDIMNTYESLWQEAQIKMQNLRLGNASPVRVDSGAFVMPDLDPYIRTTPKVGRNESCPCGSGKKYKHCHGKK